MVWEWYGIQVFRWYGNGTMVQNGLPIFFAAMSRAHTTEFRGIKDSVWSMKPPERFDIESLKWKSNALTTRSP